MYRVFVAFVVVICFCGLSLATPELYFGDFEGNAVSRLTAAAGEYVTVYIYGKTDTGNEYDYFNLGLAYNPVGLLPLTGVATSDLVMSTAGTFGTAFGHQETTYHGTSLLSAAASSMSGAPEGFGPTLLATAYFTFNGGQTEINMFNEANDYTYSTFFMNTDNLNDIRFAKTLTISAIPEPTMVGILVIGVMFLQKNRNSK